MQDRDLPARLVWGGLEDLGDLSLRGWMQCIQGVLQVGWGNLLEGP